MVKNIIFDFGDIFINLDKFATLREFSSKFGLFEITPEMDRINQAYEKGLITTNAFLNFYSGVFPKASTQDLVNAWNSVIKDFPENRLKFIEHLAKENSYELFLLSNTNELHIQQVIENMELSRYDRFKNCFIKFYLSHEINLRKPDTNIYTFVLNENNLRPEETLFVDDTEENIIAASKLGIKTWHLEPGKEDITDLLNLDCF